MAIFDLTLNGPLHQGEFVGIERESVLDWIPSDTLWAAIVSAWNALGFDASERLMDCKDGSSYAPFITTSAFPRAGVVRFYPAPPRLPEHAGMKDKGKASKKIRLISQNVLHDLSAGKTPENQDDCFIHGGSVWLSSSERNSIQSLFEEDEDGRPVLWRKQTVPHVTVDRMSNTSNLFHTGHMVFSKDCGFWFAARGKIDWVCESLNYLSQSGLGGLRSTGHGAFSWKQDPSDLPKADSGWGLCLSRYAPLSEEEIINGLQAYHSAYRLITVGGWCQDDQNHPWRRRSVRLVAEGALLPASTKGKLVDVHPVAPETWLGPQRPVWRNGIAFLIPAGKLVEAI